MTQRRPITKRASSLARGLVYVLLVWLVHPLSAQTPAPTPQDPLLSLLLAQPKMELSRPVRVTAAFDPPVIRPGQRSIYRVNFSAMDDAIDWPDKLPVDAAVPVRPGGRAQLVQMNGPVMEPRTGFNYHFTPLKPGRIAVPAFDVSVYGRKVTVPAAELEVSESAPPENAPQILSVDASPANAYVGEPVRVRIMLPASWSGVQVLAQVQLIGQGLVVDKSSVRQSIEPVGGPAGNRIAYIYEITATPIRAGKVDFHAQGWCAPNRPSTPAVVSGVPVSNGLEYLLLDSDPSELQVRPLPPAGPVPGFSGAVGSFNVDPPVLVDAFVGGAGATNMLRVGDPVKLAVTVRGTGNLARFVPPPPPQVENWQVLPAQVDRSAPQLLHAKGAISFTYTLIPLTDTTDQTPEVPFAFFEPVSGTYRTSNIPSVPVKVAPGADPLALQKLQAARAAAETPPPDPVLSGLAVAPGLGAYTMVPLQLRPWFPLVQVAPALGFIALWSWDRRRRYLRQNPHILIRRRARRALRRERRALQRSFESNNSRQFEISAVKAFRTAAAPHLGAAPDALVGTDVLQALSMKGIQPRDLEAVRRLFLVNDADTFARAPGDHLELPQLASALNRVLDRAEQALCD